MKNLLFLLTVLSFTLTSHAELKSEPLQYLTTINAEVAKAAFASYQEGHYRFIQDGKLIEAFEVDESRVSCILEGGKMTFTPEAAYALQSTRSLDVDGESGEIELNFETQSLDPDSYFQIYCFQSTSGTSLDTAREGLKGVFEIK